jgi:hypothetical protein
MILKASVADLKKGILTDLTQLAGFLCAEIVMPPPRKHLSTMTGTLFWKTNNK